MRNTPFNDETIFMPMIILPTYPSSVNLFLAPICLLFVSLIVKLGRGKANPKYFGESIVPCVKIVGRLST
ncbi:hypothetical protein K445DRAFT_316594 [Daldinia sp. EC12]|nr:hypothetical protein K445DRAFT_316594 [Daldinia sp. EC12]